MGVAAEEVVACRGWRLELFDQLAGTGRELTDGDFGAGAAVSVEGDVVQDAGVLVVERHGDVCTWRCGDRALVEGQAARNDGDVNRTAGRGLSALGSFF